MAPAPHPPTHPPTHVPSKIKDPRAGPALQCERTGGGRVGGGTLWAGAAWAPSWLTLVGQTLNEGTMRQRK